LQQVRRHILGDIWKIQRGRAWRQAELRRRLTDQYRDRVFERRALGKILCLLRTCGVELSLRPRDVQARHDSSVVTFSGQRERAIVSSNRVRKQRPIAIQPI
jgi:hypothetical protein